MQPPERTGLTIGQALESYGYYHFLSPFTDYVIIKEMSGPTFAVVPKISCCCSRFFKWCCKSTNYYTREQADKNVIAAAIRNAPNLSDLALCHLAGLVTKFGDAAAPFKARSEEFQLSLCGIHRRRPPIRRVLQPHSPSVASPVASPSDPLSSAASRGLGGVPHAVALNIIYE